MCTLSVWYLLSTTLLPTSPDSTFDVDARSGLVAISGLFSGIDTVSSPDSILDILTIVFLPVMRLVSNLYDLVVKLFK